MEIPTKQNNVYTLTCENACEVYDVDTNRLIHEHHAGEVQSQFTAIGMKSRTSDDTAIVTEVFNGASVGNGAGGGYIESDLNVGHGAAEAVAAVCTLTPGEDLDIGGTLEHDGFSVEVDPQYAELDIAVSHPEYGGKLNVANADGQSLHIFTIPAAPGSAAKATVTPLASYEAGQEYTLYIVPPGGVDSWDFAFTVTDPDNAMDEIVAALNTAANWWDEATVAVMDESPVHAIPYGGSIILELTKPGESGNSAFILSSTSTLIAETDDVDFANGGEGARDLLGLVEAMQDEDAPVEVEVNPTETGVLLTSKVGGAAGVFLAANVSGGGDLWLGVDDVSAIPNPRTLQDLATVIDDDATLMQIDSASVAAGKIVLTAPTTPTAAEYNGLAYTATGCFGSGTVKQGSSTRGKNAVEQTSFKIYLNGEELDVEPAPLPAALTPTTQMRNRGVYTVAAAFEATTLSLPANATAEIWVRIGATAFNVRLPDTWVWVNGAASDMTGKTNTTFCIAVRNDGVKVLASMQYSYGTTPAQS